MAELSIPTRDEISEQWRRDYSLRNPSADIRPGSELYARSLVMADRVLPLYSRARTIAAGSTTATCNEEQLIQRGEALGVERRGATSSTGTVIVTASTFGGTVLQGDQLIEPKSRAILQATQTRAVLDGTAVAVVSVATGTEANLAAGTKLQWVSPRPGVGLQATVAEQSDGSGLSGGAAEESVDDYRKRIERAVSATAVEREVIDAVESTTGTRVEAGFVYPAGLGPGTCGIAFTVPPGYPGGNRLPSAEQMAAVLANIELRFSGDDGYYMQTLSAWPSDLTMVVEWAQGAAGWADTSPWPPRLPLQRVNSGDFEEPTPTVIIATPSSASAAVLSTRSTFYDDNFPSPVVGQTIGVWNRSQRKFVKKRIATVTGTGPWTVTFSTDSADSDADTVATGGFVVPWSDSLPLLVDPILGFFDKLGPGEQQEDFFPGKRQRRYPSVNGEWPNRTTNRLGAELLQLPSVGNVTVEEGSDLTAPSLGEGAVYLLTVSQIGVFAS